MKRREIQDSIVADSRIKSVTFSIPVIALKSEIQDEIKLDLAVVVKTYRGVEGRREIQDTIALCQNNSV